MSQEEGIPHGPTVSSAVDLSPALALTASLCGPNHPPGIAPAAPTIQCSASADHSLVAAAQSSALEEHPMVGLRNDGTMVTNGISLQYNHTLLLFIKIKPKPVSITAHFC
jgi:hypothetical protein